MWASTLCPFSSSTRNMAFGNGSTTVPSTRIVSSLGFAREHHLQGWKRASGLGNSVTIAAELLGPLGARNGQGADRRDYLIGVVPAKPVLGQLGCEQFAELGDRPRVRLHSC